MSRIYDNIELGFKEGLSDIITNVGVKRVDLCAGYFNLRGWGLVVDDIDNLTDGAFVNEGPDRDQRVLRYCRLLVGMNRPPEELVRMMYRRQQFYPDAEFVQKCKRKMAEDFRRQLLIGVPNQQDEWVLQRLCNQLREGKVCVKLYVREPLHAKLYLAHRPEDHFNKVQAIMGSSNLTFSGLTRQGELNAEFGDSDDGKKLAQWFDDRWNDKFCIDITEDLINVIESSWASNKEIPPYHIYLKTAYHLSQDARNGIQEYELPIEFKQDLFEFQETAVKIAAKHLSNEKKGGAMIGDVVGLGKTITACAIAKLYEMHYASSTLIICPANLQDMWDKYIKKYDLKADVMSKDKKIDVESVRYYRLIIIDESHNLRNNEGARYRNIKELIQHQDCKVLLLTATPYNKDYSDLANQLRLFLDEDQDLGIRPEAYIQSLGGERQFMQKHNETFIRSIAAFEKSDKAEDWRELMKMFLVRRTRTFIKENYAKTDATNGRKYLQFKDGTRSYFPDRVPRAIKFKTTPGDQYTRLYGDQMISLMEDLKLPRYGLSNFIDQEKKKEASKKDQQQLENLSRAGARMMGFCKSTFFKRIDSSGYSFLLTLYRHVVRNMMFIYAIESKLPLPIGDECSLPEDFSEDNDQNNLLLDETVVNIVTQQGSLTKISTDAEIYMPHARALYQMISGKNTASWISSSYFKRSLKQALKKDCETILSMIELCGEWNANEDQKLNELQNLLTTLHPTEKVLVFTQYSDTAEYIAKQLKFRGIDKVGCTTGNTKNPTTLVEQFSPISNKVTLADNEELRVMIATDVLSEGQNLQDCHIVVNYDMPWAIIRLIQRAGRVDRISQQSEEVYCYSFFPADGVESVIKLRERLNKRINENADIVGSDEIFFEGNAQNLRDMFNEKAGSLDEEDDAEVDMASYAFQIWKNATDARPELKKIIPAIADISYTTKRNNGRSIDEGVITYARTKSDNDMLTWYNKKGEVVSQSQFHILNALACSADEPAVNPLECHLDLVSKAIENIKESTISSSGMLGSRFSTKYRIVHLLESFCGNPDNVLFVTSSLKEALDEIYNFPLCEQSKFILGRMLKTSADIQEIVEYVEEAHRSGNLCIVHEDSNEKGEARIICSMGLRNEEN